MGISVTLQARVSVELAARINELAEEASTKFEEQRPGLADKAEAVRKESAAEAGYGRQSESDRLFSVYQSLQELQRGKLTPGTVIRALLKYSVDNLTVDDLLSMMTTSEVNRPRGAPPKQHIKVAQPVAPTAKVPPKRAAK